MKLCKECQKKQDKEDENFKAMMIRMDIQRIVMETIAGALYKDKGKK